MTPTFPTARTPVRTRPLFLMAIIAGLALVTAAMAFLRVGEPADQLAGLASLGLLYLLCAGGERLRFRRCDQRASLPSSSTMIRTGPSVSGERILAA